MKPAPWPTSEDVVRAAGGDRAAMELVVRGMEGAVRWVAGRFASRTHLDIDELRQEARFALLYAVRNFRPEAGAFPSYARLWMRARLSRLVGGGNVNGERALSLEVSMETPLGEDRTLGDTLSSRGEVADERYAAEQRAARVRRVVGALSEDQRTVVEGRLRGETLDTVGQAMDLSRERVRQIEKLALHRMREMVQRADLG